MSNRTRGVVPLHGVGDLIVGSDLRSEVVQGLVERVVVLPHAQRHLPAALAVDQEPAGQEPRHIDAAGRDGVAEQGRAEIDVLWPACDGLSQTIISMSSRMGRRASARGGSPIDANSVCHSLGIEVEEDERVPGLFVGELKDKAVPPDRHQRTNVVRAVETETYNQLPLAHIRLEPDS